MLDPPHGTSSHVSAVGRRPPLMKPSKNFPGDAIPGRPKFARKATAKRSPWTNRADSACFAVVVVERGAPRRSAAKCKPVGGASLWPHTKAAGPHRHEITGSRPAFGGPRAPSSSPVFLHLSLTCMSVPVFARTSTINPPVMRKYRGYPTCLLRPASLPQERTSPPKCGRCRDAATTCHTACRV